MNQLTDQQLLRAYAERKSEEAFAELVRRHVDFVYSAALRMTGNAASAEDVTQGVFLALMQKGGSLTEHPSITGWLHCAARNLAGKLIRSEARRRIREQEAAVMIEHHCNDADVVWKRIAPELDAALGELSETDREAILLRYFRRQPARQMAQALGISEDAAQRRLTRAVDRLRMFFQRRGVTASAGVIASAISIHGVQSAPAGVADALSAALPGLLAGTTSATAALKAIVMTTTQKLLLTAALFASLGVATYKAIQTQTWSELIVPPGAEVATEPLTQSAANQTQPESIRSMPTSDRVVAKPDLAKLVSDLRAALRDIPRSNRGTRSYPPNEVSRAVIAFGVERSAAFAVIAESIDDPEIEIRKRAVSTLGILGMRSTPQVAPHGIIGPPASEAKPLCWRILSEGDPELAPLALSSLQTIKVEVAEVPDLTRLLSQTDNQQLQRYLPEAIAEAIRANPAGAASAVSVVEPLLHHANPDLQFLAACALAQHSASEQPQILRTLIAGLQGKSSLHQLMALETLQRLQLVAEPALQAILDFADTTTDETIKEVAFKTMGKIRKDLRSSFAEVEQIASRDERIADWNKRFVSGDYTPQDLLDALKEPMLSTTAATKLGAMGSKVRDAVPALITAMAGQDQSARERIVAAIHRIDPQAKIDMVPSRTIEAASVAATLALKAGTIQDSPSGLMSLLEKSRMGNSEWQTREELVVLATAIAAQDQGIYRVFAEKLIKGDPSLATLIPQPALP